MLFLLDSSQSLESAELKGVLFALVSAFCWAVGSSVYKKGLESTDPWSGNLIRTGCATGGFLVIMAIHNTLSQSLNVTVSLLFWLIFSSFFAFFLGDLLFLVSLKRIGVSRTVPISSTYPLFVTVWAFLVYRRPVSIFIVLGTLLIVVAIKLISEEKRSENDNGNHIRSKGIFFALLAAVCWSISLAVLDHLLLYLDTEVVAGIRFLITFLLTAAVVSTRGFTYNRNALIWIGISGTTLLVFSNYIFLEAIKITSSSRAAPVSAVYPVISVFLAAIFLKEKLTLRIIAGTLLSFLGVFFVVIG
ncbi:MAG: DMT family transporter [Theionarchaea archaeon]|nr:DMT family transporter [Theionarchaea archaeon]